MSISISQIGMLCTLLSFTHIVSSGLSGESPTAGETQTIDIGTRIEMFVDGWLIEKMAGVALTLHEPLRKEVVLVTDQPWEGPSSAYFTVFQDGPRIRLYYRGFCPIDNSGEQVTCYAESADGIRFTRPELGLHEFKGSKRNNIVHRGIESHNFAPFLDANPDARAEERYKALGGIEGKLSAFSSPDGLRWKRMGEGPVLTKGAFDSLNIAFWDGSSGLYRMYSRYFDQGFRAIQNSTSRDFLAWSDPRPNLYAGKPFREHFYTNATAPCPGAPHIYLSFPKRFVPERKKLDGYKEPGVSDAVFLTSRDGVRWDRTFREAWLRPGPDEKNWTQRSNMPAWGIVAVDPGEFTLYASEHYEWPDNRLRRLTVRRHGFASVRAGSEGGEFTTKPVAFRGSLLILNYATSAAGSIRAEIQDERGTPVPGFTLAEALELFGDELDGTFRWKGGDDLSALRGKAVRFRFVLRDADLYALRTAERPR